MFFRQLYNELLKLFMRKRTYIGFGAFLAVQLVVLALLQLPMAKKEFAKLLTNNGYEFNEFQGGLTMGLIILKFTFVLLGALYIALVAGDIVAKEIEDGNMRLILCRPVSRLRLMIIKWIACSLYTLTLVVYIGFSALATGVIYRGFLGKMLVWAPEEKIFAVFSPMDGLYIYSRSLLFMACATLTISSMAFMFSCFRMKPAAATILTLSVFFVDLVLHEIPYFRAYEKYFISSHTTCWMRTCQDIVPWGSVTGSVLYLGALTITCWIVGTMRFCTVDLKG